MYATIRKVNLALIALLGLLALAALLGTGTAPPPVQANTPPPTSTPVPSRAAQLMDAISRHADSGRGSYCTVNINGQHEKLEGGGVYAYIDERHMMTRIVWIQTTTLDNKHALREYSWSAHDEWSIPFVNCGASAAR